MSRLALLVRNALLLLHSCVTPHLRLLYFNIYIYTYAVLLYAYSYTHTHTHMLYYFFTPALPLAIHVTVVILLY